jgi:hypothetical protein
MVLGHCLLVVVISVVIKSFRLWVMFLKISAPHVDLESFLSGSQILLKYYIYI